MTLNTYISGLGIALPRTMVSSGEIDVRLGKKTGWLEKTCGVRTRPVISADETQELLGAKAAQEALAEARIDAGELDALLFAAAVGRQPIPATAPLIKREIGVGDAPFPAFDINATCLSALAAMDHAGLLILSGRAKHVLIVASEIASRALPWDTDPRTAGIFGDGAAAIVMSATTDTPVMQVDQFHMETYQQGYEYCALRSGGTRYDFHTEADVFAANSYFEMNGPKLYKLSSANAPGFIDRLLEKAGWRHSDVDLVVPHQASPHALSHISKRCGFSPDRVFNIVADTGNQVAASLPIALYKAREAGRIEKGIKVMMIGTSAGISLGGATLIA